MDDILLTSKQVMKFVFSNNIPSAEKEFNTVLKTKHYVKIDYIMMVIEAVGFNDTPEKLIKHLWGNVYELRPHDGRVLFVVLRVDFAVILGAYIKKSPKMPRNIKQKMQEREAIVLKCDTM